MGISRRLRRALQDAQCDGFVSRTHEAHELKFQSDRCDVMSLVHEHDARSPYGIFKHILKGEWVDKLLDEINDGVTRCNQRDNTRKNPVTRLELVAYFGCLLEMGLGNHEGGVSGYFKLEDRLGAYPHGKAAGYFSVLSHKRYLLICQALEATGTKLIEVYDSWSQHIVSLVAITGDCAVAFDEQMMKFTSRDDPETVIIPRKPCPLGIRVYVLSVRDPRTGWPIVLHAMPDFYDDNKLSYTVWNIGSAGCTRNPWIAKRG